MSLLIMDKKLLLRETIALLWTVPSEAHPVLKQHHSQMAYCWGIVYPPIREDPQDWQEEYGELPQFHLANVESTFPQCM